MLLPTIQTNNSVCLTNALKNYSVWQHLLLGFTSALPSEAFTRKTNSKHYIELAKF